MVSHNQEDIESYQDKSFHELLEALRHHTIKYKDLIALTIKQGQKEGISNEEIRKQILETGMSYRTMLEYIPQEMKQEQQHVKSRQKVARSQPTYKRDQSRLVVDEPPKLPPPEQPIIEPELEPTPRELDEIATFNQEVREHVTQPRRHEEAFMPLPLADQLNKFLLARMIGMARSNGDTSIKFKINKEGELYVP